MFRAVLLAAMFMAVSLAQDAALVRVSEVEAKKAISSKVDPEYPSMARQMNLYGRVVVDVFIDEEGKVEKVQPVTGNQLLTSAAVTAVKKWRFNPFQKKVVTSVAFDFKL